MTSSLSGRRGTYGFGGALGSQLTPLLCVAGVALMVQSWLWCPFGAVGAAAVCVAGLTLRDIDRHFAWQVWHLWQFSAVGAAAVCRGDP